MPETRMICWDRVATSTGYGKHMVMPAFSNGASVPAAYTDGSKHKMHERQMHVRTQRTPSARPSREPNPPKPSRDGMCKTNPRLAASGPRRPARVGRVRQSPPAVASAKCTNEMPRRHVRTQPWRAPARFSRTIYLAPATRLGPRLPRPNGDSPRPPAQKKTACPKRAAVQSLRGTMELLHPENTRAPGSFHGRRNFFRERRRGLRRRCPGPPRRACAAG